MLADMRRILGQSRAVDTLAGALRSGRLHHGWIFSGPKGVGKYTTALEFARILLDPAAETDEQSQSSRLVDAGTHPDLHLVYKELALHSDNPRVRLLKLLTIPIDVLRERDGMNRREALVQGGKTRFRPVVLTALTTALGMVPLAIGLNFNFFGLYTSLTPELYWGGQQAAWWGPMAVAIIAGILFATFLTLILVPVMYSLVDDFTEIFRKHYGHLEDDDTLSTPDPVDEPDMEAPVSGPRHEPSPIVEEPEAVGARRHMVRPHVFDPLTGTS